MTNAGFDWRAFVFRDAQAWDRSFRSIASRRFPDAGLAEEAFTHAFEKLAADDFARLRVQRVTTDPQGLLNASFRNLLEDFARKRFGRKRPPAWLVAAGDLYLLVYRMLCWERQMVPSIEDFLKARRAIAAETTRIIVTRIKARIPDCGMSSLDVPLEGDLADPEDHGAGPEASTRDEQHDAALEAMRVLLGEVRMGRGADAASRLPEAVAAAAERAALDDERLLLLRLHFVEGLSFAEAARRLGCSPKQAERSIKSSLARLREQMLASGVTV
jgi:predicted DNA-binding protein (UPF0251 family)